MTEEHRYQPGFWAARHPDKPAVIIDGGRTVTYGELDDRSRRLARHWGDAGLRRGDHVALLLENGAEFFEAVWAAQRSGLHWTPVNWHLSAAEAGYVIDDCDAVALVTSAKLADVAAATALAPKLRSRLMLAGGGGAGFADYETTLASSSPEPLPDAEEGAPMLYSSGTTGKPKGILRPLPGEPVGRSPGLLGPMAAHYGFGADTVYLNPAPLYHSAPAVWSITQLRYGATVVVMPSFDAESALRLIETHRVTVAQFVPTHFVRLLKLPAEVRRRYDLSSLRVAIHAAAPCPIEVKRQMIDWWGPIIHEYFAASECGYVAIDSQEWLQHPGSVGRPGGTAHILDEDGRELPAGSVGTIWWEDPTVGFEYYHDPKKTSRSHNDRGWATVGDLGYLDEQGYLYSTGRSAELIISGGVNIYPREAEDVLTLHPAVADVAVIGVPDEEFGEAVKAVVQPAPGVQPAPELGAQLVDYCRQRLAHYKCPRSVDFVEELPRLPNGKLLKRALRERYWPAPANRS